MAITITSREFNQRASQVLKMAETQPIFITRWGKVVGVLSNYQDYQQQQTEKEKGFEQLFAGQASIADEDFDEFQRELDHILRNMKFRVCEFEDVE